MTSFFRGIQSLFLSLIPQSSIYEEMVRASNAPLCLTDSFGKIHYVNHAFATLMGFATSSLIGNHISLFNSNKNEKGFCEQLWKQLQHEHSFNGKIWNQHKDGEDYLHLINVTQIDTANSYYLFTHFDITEQVKLQEQYRYLAHHDSLTGLANRILLEDRLTHAIDNAIRTGKSVGVIFCDLNEFKSVNDDFGHLIGDQVLQEMGKRIKSVCRSNDTVARFGGDEFMIIVEQLNYVSELNKLTDTLIKKIAEPMEDMGFSLSASIGVATFPSDGMTKDQLIEIADKNMYRKKIQFHGIA